MSSYSSQPSSGLPSYPRANLQMLSRLDTSFSSHSPERPSPYSSTSEKQYRDSPDIFASATIPLSPASTSWSPRKENPYAGLEPRKRNAFARLFCCLGREERARRRVVWATEFETVGDKVHWSEY